MAMDNRDYYRDKLRKESGYVERASFRVPVSQLRVSRRPKPAEPSFWVWPIRILLVLALFLFFRWLRK